MASVRETPESVLQGHLNRLYTQLVDPLKNLEIAPKRLNKEVIETYAEHSPTAKKCLEAYNKYLEGFAILLQSDYRDPECFKLIVEGFVLENTLHNNLLTGVDQMRYFMLIQEHAKVNPYALLLSLQSKDIGVMKSALKKIEKCEEINCDLRRKMLSKVHHTMGAFYAIAEKNSEAIECLKESLKVCPEEIGCLVDMSKMHISSSKTISQRSIEQAKRCRHYTAALKLCEQFLEAAPECNRNYPSALYNKAFILSERGDQTWIGFYQMAQNAEKKRLPFLDKLDAIGKTFLDLHHPTAYCANCEVYAEVRRKWRLCACGEVYYCGEKCQREGEVVHRGSCSAVAGCSFCERRPAVGVQLKQCAACRRAAYCGKDCQKKHWSTHKLQCHQLKCLA